MAKTDIHCHVNWLDMDIDAWAKHFTELGIDRVFALGWEELDRRWTGEYELPTEDQIEAAERYPDLFVPWCSVDPREKDVPGKIREHVKRGCRGFGECKIRLLVDNPDLKVIYRTCDELGLPILFHVDIWMPGVPHWYMMDLTRLPAVLEEFPNVQFIGHGPGWWREMSGDADDHPTNAYPEGPITPGGRLPELLAKYDNLHADLSAGSGLGGITRDPEFGRQFLIDLSDKLMYGTDYFDRRLLDAIEGYNLPEDVYEKIMDGNSRKLIP